MAVHDGERYLRASIDSILGQTLEDFELIVVDDGSRDRTRDIVRSYQDPRVRLLENPRNLGLAPTLNRGLGEARGEFVARQDDDDVSERRRLESQVRFLDAHPEIALLGTWYAEIDEAGRPGRRRQLPVGGAELLWTLLFHCPFVHSAVMFRREPVLERVGGYDESLSYAMDYDLWYRISRRMAVANLDEHLLRLRLHGASLTETCPEGVREGPALRAGIVGGLLGWPEESAGWERRLDAMRGVLYGSRTDAPRQEVESASELLRLHEAFCPHFRLEESVCVGHRRRLRQRLSARLLRQSFGALRRGDARGFARLSASAHRIDPGVVVRQVGAVLSPVFGRSQPQTTHAAYPGARDSAS